MNCSQETDKVFAAFYEFQQKFDGLTKDGRSHHGNYITLPNMISHAKTAASGTGIAIAQSLHYQPDHIGCETIVMHISGQWFSNGIIYMPVMKKSPQDFGSLISYCRRYSMGSALAAASEIDDDGNKAMPAPINLSKPRVDLATIREDIPEIGNESAHTHGAWIPPQKSKQSAQMLFAACQTKQACEELKGKLLQKVLAIEDKVLADQKSDELQKAFDDRIAQLL